ncbi:hypothetical protein Btru_064830 [Bulinus truncatus]|nr:hypothetical protein Btru_064830 [Bulinus truncatus]
MMQLSKFLAKFKSSSLTPEEAFRQTVREAMRKHHGEEDLGGINNNESESEDLQISRESRAIQPKTSSMSTTSRSSMRRNSLQTTPAVLAPKVTPAWIV